MRNPGTAPYRRRWLGILRGCDIVCAGGSPNPPVRRARQAVAPERGGGDMDKAPKFRLETFFDFFLLFLGLVISIISWGYGFGSLRQPGPGLYPFFVGAAIAIFSLFILVSVLRSGAGEPVLDKEGARTLALMTLTFCLWIVAMPLLGYVVVSL